MPTFVSRRTRAMRLKPRLEGLRPQSPPARTGNRGNPAREDNRASGVAGRATSGPPRWLATGGCPQGQGALPNFIPDAYGRTCESELRLRGCSWGYFAHLAGGCGFESRLPPPHVGAVAQRQEHLMCFGDSCLGASFHARPNRRAPFRRCLRPLARSPAVHSRDRPGGHSSSFE